MTFPRKTTTSPKIGPQLSPWMLLMTYKIETRAANKNDIEHKAAPLQLMLSAGMPVLYRKKLMCPYFIAKSNPPFVPATL